jgi:hypothetical protein
MPVFVTRYKPPRIRLLQDDAPSRAGDESSNVQQIVSEMAEDPLEQRLGRCQTG